MTAGAAREADRRPESSRIGRAITGAGAALRGGVHACAELSPSDPQDTTLHRILRSRIETFLTSREEADAPMKGFVVRELRR